MTQRRIEYWVIPPQADAEFVAHMEQVLDLYQKPPRQQNLWVSFGSGRSPSA